MAAPRANWKGYLKLSLVSCPIALYPASRTTEKTSFNRLNRKTGRRLRQRLVDEGSGKEVPNEDIARGFEFQKGNYIIVEDDELEAIKLESKRNIEIGRFVPLEEIDPRYVERPYYVAPDDDVGAEAFAVVREAMRDRGVAGIGRVMLSSRERYIALQAHHRGMLGLLLRYPYEVRSEVNYFNDIGEQPIEPELVEMAEKLIDQKLDVFDPKAFEDTYEAALRDLISQKQKGVPIKAAPDVNVPLRVVDLMDALRKSVVGDRRARPTAARKQAAPARPARGTKRPAARRA